MDTSAATQQARDTFDDTRERLQRQLEEARHQLSMLQDEAVHRARRAARQADHAVHTHPYGAMAAAAAVGVLVGLLVGRR